MDHPIDEDAYANNYYHFRKSLGVLSQDPEEQCRAMDYFNVAWELRRDVLDHGHAVLSTGGAQLLEHEKQKIARLLDQVAEIPDAVVNTVVDVPNSRESHRKAMNDRCWVPLRTHAKELIAALSAETARVYTALGVNSS